ncbi:AraC family transcriptional regulator (plasmid) [Sphaerotilus natans]|uniref:AraC family transcriptional regulator n=1 Tax=Sphaerotilus natans TaxID=34103 RepID=UPI00406C1C3C
MRRPDANAALTLHLSPYPYALPAPLVFRAVTMPARARYDRHRHAWGEFVYSFSGVMEVQMVGAQTFLAPPQFGIWLPPEVEHIGLNRQAAVHSSLYVDAALCTALPPVPCALAVDAVARAVLEHLRAHPPALPAPPEAQRLMQVLVDRLAQARPLGSYLPRSGDPALAAVLAALEADPGDERPLAAWAAQVHSTERTLARRCQRDLGMSFAEWRQRLRIVRALPRLEAGEKVASVALDLGYASASAFIAMFRRVTGATPREAAPASAGRAQPVTDSG